MTTHEPILDPLNPDFPLFRNWLKQGHNQVDNKSGKLENHQSLFFAIGGILKDHVHLPAGLLGTTYYLIYHFQEVYVIIILTPEARKLPLYQLIEDQSEIVFRKDFHEKYVSFANYIEVTRQPDVIKKRLIGELDMVSWSSGMWFRSYSEVLFRRMKNYQLSEDFKTNQATYTHKEYKYHFTISLANLDSFSGPARKQELSNRIMNCTIQF